MIKQKYTSNIYINNEKKDFFFNKDVNNNNIRKLLDENYVTDSFIPKYHVVNNNNIRKLLDENYVTDSFIPKKEKSTSQEWVSSVYNYNKNNIKLLPSAHELAHRFIKSYFSLKQKLKIKKSKRINFRRRRLSFNNIITSRPWVKHNNDKVIITIYLYNKTKKILDNKMKKAFKSTLLMSNGLSKINLKCKLKNLVKSKANQKIFIKYLPVVRSKYYWKNLKMKLRYNRKNIENLKQHFNFFDENYVEELLDLKYDKWEPKGISLREAQALSRYNILLAAYNMYKYRTRNKYYYNLHFGALSFNSLSKVKLPDIFVIKQLKNIFTYNEDIILKPNKNDKDNLLESYHLYSINYERSKNGITKKKDENLISFPSRFYYEENNVLHSEHFHANGGDNLSDFYNEDNDNENLLHINNNKLFMSPLKKFRDILVNKQILTNRNKPVLLKNLLIYKKKNKKLTILKKRIIGSYRHIHRKIFIVKYDKLYNKKTVNKNDKKHLLLINNLKNNSLKKNITLYKNKEKSDLINLSTYNEKNKKFFSLKPLFKTKTRNKKNTYLPYHSSKSQFLFNKINNVLKLNDIMYDKKENLKLDNYKTPNFMNDSNSDNRYWRKNYFTLVKAVNKIRLKYELASTYAADANTDIYELTRHKKKHLKRYIRKAFYKETLFLYFKKLNKYNDNLFKDWKLYHLKTLLSSIYNKKVEFNLVNVKYMFLNSDIYTQSISLKIKNNKNKLLRVLKKALSMVNKPIITKYRLFYESHHINQNIVKNKYNAFDINTITNTVYGDPITNSFNNIFMQNNNKFLYKMVNLTKNVLNSIKHKYVFGVRLEASGRLTKRRTASKSVFKLRYKGNLKDLNCLHRNLPSLPFRSNQNSNVQYTQTSNKKRNGSFGLKGWISSN